MPRPSRPPPRFNLFTEAVVRVWLHADVYDDEIVECDDAFDVGVRPEWLERELAETGWSDIISMEWHSGESVARWALAEGLAHRQPFLVELPAPVYSKTYEGEYDVDFDARVIARAELAPAEAAKRWADWVCSARAAALHQKAERLKRRARAEATRKNLRIWLSQGCLGECCSDCCCGPHSISATLVAELPRDSAYPDVYQLVQVRDGEERRFARGAAEPVPGTVEGALAKLVAQVSLRLPHLSPEMIRALPTRW